MKTLTAEHKEIKMGAPSAASTEPIADALLVTAKRAGAALVAGADVQYAKEASYE
jgi:hypothetical protein